MRVARRTSTNQVNAHATTPKAPKTPAMTRPEIGSPPLNEQGRRPDSKDDEAAVAPKATLHDDDNASRPRQDTRCRTVNRLSHSELLPSGMPTVPCATAR